MLNVAPDKTFRAHLKIFGTFPALSRSCWSGREHNCRSGCRSRSCRSWGGCRGWSRLPHIYGCSRLATQTNRKHRSRFLKKKYSRSPRWMDLSSCLGYIIDHLQMFLLTSRSDLTLINKGTVAHWPTAHRTHSINRTQEWTGSLPSQQLNFVCLKKFL